MRTYCRAKGQSSVVSSRPLGCSRMWVICSRPHGYLLVRVQAHSYGGANHAQRPCMTSRARSRWASKAGAAPGATVEPHIGPTSIKVCATIRTPPRCAEEAHKWQWPGDEHQEEAGDLWVLRVPKGGGASLRGPLQQLVHPGGAHLVAAGALPRVYAGALRARAQHVVRVGHQGPR